MGSFEALPDDLRMLTFKQVSSHYSSRLNPAASAEGEAAAQWKISSRSLHFFFFFFKFLPTSGLSFPPTVTC